MITSKSVEVQLKILCRLSFPMEIFSDNGSKLTSSFMKEVFQYDDCPHQDQPLQAADKLLHQEVSPYNDTDGEEV